MEQSKAKEYFIRTHYAEHLNYPNMPTMMAELCQKYLKVYAVIHRISIYQKQASKSKECSIILNHNKGMIELCKYADAYTNLELLLAMRGLYVRHASH